MLQTTLNVIEFGMDLQTAVDAPRVHHQWAPDRLWLEGAVPFTRATGTDARVGRHTFRYMRQLGLGELRVDYVVVDTLRVPRVTFAAIIEAWRDGYAQVLGERSRLTAWEAPALFDQIINSILDPDSYAVWHVPIISGRKRTSQ